MNVRSMSTVSGGGGGVDDVYRTNGGLRVPMIQCGVKCFHLDERPRTHARTHTQQQHAQNDDKNCCVIYTYTANNILLSVVLKYAMDSVNPMSMLLRARTRSFTTQPSIYSSRSTSTDISKNFVYLFIYFTPNARKIQSIHTSFSLSRNKRCANSTQMKYRS